MGDVARWLCPGGPGGGRHKNQSAKDYQPFPGTPKRGVGELILVVLRVGIQDKGTLGIGGRETPPWGGIRFKIRQIRDQIVKY